MVTGRHNSLHTKEINIMEEQHIHTYSHLIIFIHTHTQNSDNGISLQPTIYIHTCTYNIVC